MKKYLKSYRHTLALFAILVLALALFNIGLTLGRSPLDALALPILVVALWQLSQFALSKRCGACFHSSFTPEQVKEFEDIMKEMKEFPKRLDQVERNVDNIRRLNLRGGGQAVIRAGQLVTDDCAEYLAAIAIVGAEKKGKLSMLPLGTRQGLLERSGSILGIQERAALTTSDIPLPTLYSGQVVQLVNQYGAARKYGTVFPLGTGTMKLPKLTTDTTFGLIAASATVTEKSPQVGWVTFTAEKFGGLVRLPTEIDEDSIIGIGNFIADYAARNIALAEDYNYFLSTGAGSGVNGSVKGLCLSTIDNSKVVQMSSTKTHYSDATLANVRSLRQVPDAAALNEAAYYMHPSFEQLLASFNTAGDRPYNPIAQLQGSGAQPFITGPTLDGFPVRWVPAMPAYSTSANVSKVFMLFGALRYQYLGVLGQLRFQTSMEAAFDTDEILIRALERFTIGLMATGAVGGLETAAS